MCKMEHFGNCDPETADQEYCIFHKPNKSEEEAVEFWGKFFERFKPRIEEIEVDGKKIKRLVFEDYVECMGYVFPRPAGEYSDLFFQFSVFKRGVNFENSIFKWRISFRNSEFYDRPHFPESTLDRPVKFPTIKEFIGYLKQHSQDKFAILDGLMVPGVTFRNAIFEDGAYFDRAIFHCNVSFDNASFKSKSCESYWANISPVFATVVFEDSVSFVNSRFENANFHLLSGVFRGSLILSNSIFQGKLLFVWPDIIDELEDLMSHYEGFMFHSYLDFSNVILYGGIEIDFDSGLFKLPEAEIEARRVQRLSFEKEGKREEADRMFVLEMRAKRRARLKNARGKLSKVKAYVHNFVEWLLADLSSEYGTNWVRLFLFSLLVIIGNAVPYTIWSHQIDGFPETSNIVVRFANALYYSLVTFTTLGYGDMHPTGWLKALSAIEALTGAVFMALIVAVIARKWMR
ncbi:potassium channel family protein [Thermococcus sp. JdF3]|uniref:potassium channel family protein n=1 Tax=Thermococcus sp. JdF3 TaxID=1638258 RepID=UPI00143A2D9F|nr:potassium channel family protein [Thermococcus sp. JdF3]NJE02189.1 hypothetical protein [Thermococcus sp. JdF3]